MSNTSAPAASTHSGPEQQQQQQLLLQHDSTSPPPELHSGSARGRLEAVWLAWPGGGLTPLLLRNGPAMGQDGAGVRWEAGEPGQ